MDDHKFKVNVNHSGLLLPWTTPKPNVCNIVRAYVEKGTLIGLTQDNYVESIDVATGQTWLQRFSSSGKMVIRQVPRITRKLDRGVDGVQFRMFISEKLYTESQYRRIKWALRQMSRGCSHHDVYDALSPHWRHLYGQTPLHHTRVNAWRMNAKRRAMRGWQWPE